MVEGKEVLVCEMIEETGITSQFSRFISVVRLIGLFETIFREKSFSNVE